MRILKKPLALLLAAALLLLAAAPVFAAQTADDALPFENSAFFETGAYHSFRQSP